MAEQERGSPLPQRPDTARICPLSPVILPGPHRTPDYPSLKAQGRYVYVAHKEMYASRQPPAYTSALLPNPTPRGHNTTALLTIASLGTSTWPGTE